MLTAETIMTRWLRPLYPPDAPEGAPGATPSHPVVLNQLEDAARVFVAMHPTIFGSDLTLDYTDASIHRLGGALTRSVRDELATSGPPGTSESELFNVIVHGVAYVGATIVRAHAASWMAWRPLWESRVRLQSPAGDAELAILSWWLRALADDERAGLA